MVHEAPPFSAHGSQIVRIEQTTSMLSHVEELIVKKILRRATTGIRTSDPRVCAYATSCARPLEWT